MKVAEGSSSGMYLCLFKILDCRQRHCKKTRSSVTHNELGWGRITKKPISTLCLWLIPIYRIFFTHWRESDEKGKTTQLKDLDSKYQDHAVKISGKPDTSSASAFILDCNRSYLKPFSRGLETYFFPRHPSLIPGRPCRIFHMKRTIVIGQDLIQFYFDDYCSIDLQLTWILFRLLNPYVQGI